MIGKLYPSWIESTVKGTEVYSGSTYTALLLKGSYSFLATHIYLDDLDTVTHEVAGYTRVAPSGLSISRNLQVTSVTFDPIVFSTVTGTGADAPKYMVLALDTGAASTSPLILIQDFETTIDLTAEDLTITPSAAGLIRYTVAS